MCYPDPKVSSDDGKTLLDFVPAKGEKLDTCICKDGKRRPGLSYEGELNKVAANVIIGRYYTGAWQKKKNAVTINIKIHLVHFMKSPVAGFLSTSIYF